MRAIHNRSRSYRSSLRMFPICQRYDMRAIHNATMSRFCGFPDVSNMSKIRYESNSQPRCKHKFSFL